MHTQHIPAGWGLWYHATTHRFSEFDDEQRLCNLGNDGNSALGHFLSATLPGAIQYLQHARERGHRCDVLIVAALEERRYQASLSEFWCQNEVFPDEEEDPLGLLPPGGMLTREKLMAEGFASLHIDNIDDTGAVLAMFEARNLRILKRLQVCQAERLDVWLDQHHHEVVDPNARYTLIEQWCVQDNQADRKTLGGLRKKYSSPVTAPMPCSQ